MYLTRTLERHFLKVASQFPVALLTGARQVGKTTMLKRLADEERRYVTLDDPLILELARNDPFLFFQRFPPPVLIDEIQYAPELLPVIKLEADSSGAPGRFWLTGSQQFHMMKGVSESLAGRVGIVNLSGLGYREMKGLAGDASPFRPWGAEISSGERDALSSSLKDLFEIIWRGSFPAMVSRPDLDHAMFFSSYAQTYIQRDLRDLARVGDEMAFFRFLKAAAARTAQLVNTTDLARDIGISPNTAAGWLSILQASDVVHLVEPFHTNLTKRLVKACKLYFVDTGLCCWLTGWTSPVTLEAGAFSGPVFETWVVSEIMKSWKHCGLRPPMFHFRNRNGREIDLLLEFDGMIHPVEIKKTASPSRDDLRHFAALENLGVQSGSGSLVCMVSEPKPITRSVWAIPAWSI